MSQQIIKRWELAVLRVGLDVSGRAPLVTSRLDGYASGAVVTYLERTDPLEAFGLSNSAETPTHVGLPPRLVQQVRSTMEDQLQHETALWLRLEPPYGYLGAAPWEDLALDIEVPVLRVPDRLPTPTHLGRTWRVVLAVSAPRNATWGAKHVRELTSALEEEFGGSVEIDVFADLHSYQRLLADRSRDPRVRVHDPHKAQYAHQLRTSQSATWPRGRRAQGVRTFEPINDPRLLWADWIVTGLGGHAVSAFHVAALGQASVDRPMLAIAPDPSHAVSLASCSTVEINDLWSLADTLGASLLSIAAPEARSVDVGARMIADGLGQLRPGPTLFSSLSRDPGGRALAQMHAFLADPSVRDLPSHASWFGYIQPESIKSVLTDPLLPHDTGPRRPDTTKRTRGIGIDHEEPRASRDADGALERMFENVDEVPAWVASSSRFLEGRHAALNSLLPPDGEGKATKFAYDLGASKALADIEALIQRHAGEK